MIHITLIKLMLITIQYKEVGNVLRSTTVFSQIYNKLKELYWLHITQEFLTWIILDFFIS